jgi:hypothetical protein
MNEPERRHEFSLTLAGPNQHGESQTVRHLDGYLIEVGQATGVLHWELAEKGAEDLPG